MRKNISVKNLSQWIPEIYNYSEIFSDLKLLLCADKNTSQQLSIWPDCQLLMTYLKADLCSLSGSKITMHPQDRSIPYPNMSYEERIYKKGIISTREKNWHDFFNAMIWGLFPETKKLLNLLHIKEMKYQSTNLRTRSRDAITHLDESGIIIASSQPELLEQLRNHRWLEVFYQQRDLWTSSISAYIFGHGMYEKALNPFIGFTGKMYPISVDEHFFKQNRAHQYEQLDQLLSADIDKTKTMKNNKKLSPFPILGVPGWYKGHQQESFYLNSNYFRVHKNILMETQKPAF